MANSAGAAAHVRAASVLMASVLCSYTYVRSVCYPFLFLFSHLVRRCSHFRSYISTCPGIPHWPLSVTRHDCCAFPCFTRTMAEMMVHLLSPSLPRMAIPISVGNASADGASWPVFRHHSTADTRQMRSARPRARGCDGPPLPLSHGAAAAFRIRSFRTLLRCQNMQRSFFCATLLVQYMIQIDLLFGLFLDTHSSQ